MKNRLHLEKLKKQSVNQYIQSVVQTVFSPQRVRSSCSVGAVFNLNTHLFPAVARYGEEIHDRTGFCENNCCNVNPLLCNPITANAVTCENVIVRTMCRLQCQKCKLLALQMFNFSAFVYTSFTANFIRPTVYQFVAWIEILCPLKQGDVCEDVGICWQLSCIGFEGKNVYCRKTCGTCTYNLHS